MEPISVVTITRNRGWCFPLAVQVWNALDYPSLEWVIVDDDDAEDMRAHLKAARRDGDRSVVYHRIGPEHRRTLADKRNYAVSLTSHELIAHHDTDDYYFPQHLRDKLDALNTHGKDCAYAPWTATLDVMRPRDACFSVRRTGYTEGSLLFRKSMWREQGFGFVEHRPEEGAAFLAGCELQCVGVDWRSNALALVHGQNILHGTEGAPDADADSEWDVAPELEDRQAMRLIEGIRCFWRIRPAVKTRFARDGLSPAVN